MAGDPVLKELATQEIVYKPEFVFFEYTRKLKSWDGAMADFAEITCFP
jgi:hypothetical protein